MSAQHETQFRLKISNYPVSKDLDTLARKHCEFRGNLRISEDGSRIRIILRAMDWIPCQFLNRSQNQEPLRNHSALPKSLIFENALTASEKNGLPPRNAVLAQGRSHPGANLGEIRPEVPRKIRQRTPFIELREWPPGR